jgi:hypothetical protein
MPVHTPVKKRGVYFITFTRVNRHPLIEFTKAYDLVYNFFAFAGKYLHWSLAVKRMVVFLFFLISIPACGQAKLFLKKGSHQVRLKPGYTVGVVTKTDSISYNSSPWKLDSILPDTLSLKKPHLYEYTTVPANKAAKMLDAEWIMDSVIIDTADEKSYILKRPNSYIQKKFSYNDVSVVQYAQSEDQSGCIGCIIFPVMIIAAPFAGWDKGKFYPQIFIPFFTIGVGGTWLILNSFKRREVKTYKIGEWKFHIKSD